MRGRYKRGWCQRVNVSTTAVFTEYSNTGKCKFALPTAKLLLLWRDCHSVPCAAIKARVSGAVLVVHGCVLRWSLLWPSPRQEYI